MSYSCCARYCTVYSYRDAQMTKGLSRQGVGSAGPVPGAFSSVASLAGTMPAGLNRYSTMTRQDVHLKCPWRAAVCANVLNAAHVAEDSPC